MAIRTCELAVSTCGRVEHWTRIMDRDLRFLGHRPEEFFGAALIWIGGLLLFAASALIACQALYWLRWGE
jgi:hypothetical protein